MATEQPFAFTAAVLRDTVRLVATSLFGVRLVVSGVSTVFVRYTELCCSVVELLECLR